MAIPSGKKIFFAAGGTGGHLFPAQALADQICRENKNVQLLFVGANLSSNPYFDKIKFAFCDVTSTTPFGGGYLKLFKSIATLLKGIRESLRLFQREKPDLVVGFGSFHVFPVLCASIIRRVPLVLFESNAIPGKVVRLFSKRAKFCGIYFAEASKHLKGETIEVEIPQNKERLQRIISKEEAQTILGLDPHLPTVLVFGGSQGAKKINQTMLELLPQLKEASASIQLIHFTGSDEMAIEISAVCKRLGILSYVKKFESQMQIAWSAADIVICRSGAMTLSELLQYEVPGILIPFPFAADQHQLKNALFLENKVGGAVHFVESALNPGVLVKTILKLTTQDSAQRSAMKDGIKNYKAQQKKEDLGRLIGQLLINLR